MDLPEQFMRDNLATLIDDFRRFDRETAVVHFRGNRRHVSTYGDLARLAGRFAAFLAEHGIVEGDRVLLWAENSAEWIAAFYGCLLRGVLAVPLDAAGNRRICRSRGRGRSSQTGGGRRASAGQAGRRAYRATNS